MRGCFIAVSVKKLSVYFIFFFFLTIADTLVIIFLNEYVFKQVNANNKVIAYICFVFIAIGMLVQIGMFFLLAVSKNAYKQMNVMNVKFLQEQSKHYLYLEARENETKKFRHDIRSHLNCIKDLIDKGQYKTASDYMENVYGKFEKIGTYVTVHNGVVDAILNKNYSQQIQLLSCTCQPNSYQFQLFLLKPFSIHLSESLEYCQGACICHDTLSNHKPLKQRHSLNS